MRMRESIGRMGSRIFWARGLQMRCPTHIVVLFKEGEGKKPSQTLGGGL